jgi:hypothetical protein
MATTPYAQEVGCLEMDFATRNDSSIGAVPLGSETEEPPHAP